MTQQTPRLSIQIRSLETRWRDALIARTARATNGAPPTVRATITRRRSERVYNSLTPSSAARLERLIKDRPQ